MHVLILFLMLLFFVPFNKRNMEKPWKCVNSSMPAREKIGKYSNIKNKKKLNWIVS